MEEYYRVGGNHAFTLHWLKGMVIVLLLACLGLTTALVVKIIDSRKENIVPIVINEATGDALVVDYRVIDSTGENRASVEVRKCYLII
jgi:hypothetical protein